VVGAGNIAFEVLGSQVVGASEWVELKCFSTPMRVIQTHMHKTQTLALKGRKPPGVSILNLQGHHLTDEDTCFPLKLGQGFHACGPLVRVRIHEGGEGVEYGMCGSERRCW